MQKFIGVKLLKAKPMNRQDYLDLRGWKLPEDENGADEGYLVEYIDGGQANTKQFEGYVSWSPKEVFERTYSELPEPLRELDDHKINPANDSLSVLVHDEPGQGNACHNYSISHPGLRTVQINFQNGPINEDGNGVNGLTHEVLLAIVADRLRGFQSGPYSCKENACALTKIEEAQHWLQQRTLKRMRRGVEGTHKV